jgi:hypothetical protein
MICFENKNKGNPPRRRGCAEKCREYNGIARAFVARIAGKKALSALLRASSVSQRLKRESDFHARVCAPRRMKDCFQET